MGRLKSLPPPTTRPTATHRRAPRRGGATAHSPRTTRRQAGTSRHRRHAADNAATHRHPAPTHRHTAGTQNAHDTSSAARKPQNTKPVTHSCPTPATGPGQHHTHTARMVHLYMTTPVNNASPTLNRVPFPRLYIHRNGTIIHTIPSQTIRESVRQAAWETTPPRRGAMQDIAWTKMRHSSATSCYCSKPTIGGSRSR